jgi:hypothetical protein
MMGDLSDEEWVKVDHEAERRWNALATVGVYNGTRTLQESWWKVDSSVRSIWRNAVYEDWIKRGKL